MDGQTAKACNRVKMIGNGAHVNIVYKLNPIPALEVFRADLLLVVAAAMRQ